MPVGTIAAARRRTVAISTSYSDTYSTGDRRSIITVTLVNLTLTGNASDLINGNNSTGPGTFFTGATGDGTGGFKFQLTNPRFINGVKLYQSDGTSHGTWRWEWSDDGLAWTQLGSDFTLGGSTTDENLLTGSTTEHAYWFLRHMSGARSATPYEWEFEFKAGLNPPVFTVSPTIANNAGFTPGAVGDTYTATPGTVSNADSNTYQWKADGTNISGATGLTFTATGSESGKTLTFTQTATNSAGSTTSTSAGIGPIAASPTYTTQNLTLSDGSTVTLSDASNLELYTRTA